MLHDTFVTVPFDARVACPYLCTYSLIYVLYDRAFFCLLLGRLRAGWLGPLQGPHEAVAGVPPQPLLSGPTQQRQQRWTPVAADLAAAAAAARPTHLPPPAARVPSRQVRRGPIPRGTRPRLRPPRTWISRTRRRRRSGGIVVVVVVVIVVVFFFFFFFFVGISVCGGGGADSGGHIPAGGGDGRRPRLGLRRVHLRQRSQAQDLRHVRRAQAAADH